MSEPKPYEVPDGHLIQLGADVLDGWEGRRQPTLPWISAERCNDEWPNTILETRRVPERMVTVELPESVARGAADSLWLSPIGVAVKGACRKALEVDR